VDRARAGWKLDSKSQTGYKRVNFLIPISIDPKSQEQSTTLQLSK
jgi:hypothetical protein